MKELIQGAYDLHVHSAPDVLPRKLDDLEMGRRIAAAGMGGYCIKSTTFAPGSGRSCSGRSSRTAIFWAPWC